MSGRQRTIREHLLNRLLELQKTHGVGNCRTVLPGLFSDLFLRKMEIVGQFLKGMRLLNWVQVLALEIFDQRHLKCRLLWNVADDDGHAAHLRALRRTPMKAISSAFALSPLNTAPFQLPIDQ